MLIYVYLCSVQEIPTNKNPSLRKDCYELTKRLNSPRMLAKLIVLVPFNQVNKNECALKANPKNHKYMDLLYSHELNSLRYEV